MQQHTSSDKLTNLQTHNTHNTHNILTPLSYMERCNFSIYPMFVFLLLLSLSANDQSFLFSLFSFLIWSLPLLLPHTRDYVQDDVQVAFILLARQLDRETS